LYRVCILLMVAAACLAAVDQPPEPPLTDKRISVHTLVREDIFAGFRQGDMDRLARGEKRIELLLEQRPAETPALLAWKASALLYRAVRAHEASRREEFNEKYSQAIELLARAKRLGPDDLGATATTAGVYAFLADRLPETLRGAAWSTAYESFQTLWKRQARDIEKLPLHMRGELLGGLAESAQRTGRTQEVAEYLDKILAVAPDTAYAEAAQRWKKDPKAATATRLTCLSCHAGGRLSARQSALKDK
jgi:tetratricopeptide (TPR) repeat protein